MHLRDGEEAKRLFKKLPFYMQFIEKPSIKRLINIDMHMNVHFMIN